MPNTMEQAGSGASIYIDGRFYHATDRIHAEGKDPRHDLLLLRRVPFGPNAASPWLTALTIEVLQEQERIGGAVLLDMGHGGRSRQSSLEVSTASMIQDDGAGGYTTAVDRTAVNADA